MNFAQLLFPDFSLILIGYLLCRFTALNRSVWSSIDSLVYYFLFPVLLFQAILKSPLELGATSSLIGAALCLAAGGIALSYSLPHWPWLGKRFDLRLHAGIGLEARDALGIEPGDELLGFSHDFRADAVARKQKEFIGGHVLIHA